jgi:DNA modification methylase
MNVMDDESGLLRSLRSEKRVSGLTHSFYRYPARFSPEFAKEIIARFSDKGDLILDAFMGSGTSIVEAVANGRIAIGVDINPIAYFVARVKTTPLSKGDRIKVTEWAKGIESLQLSEPTSTIDANELKNIPERFKHVFVDLTRTTNALEFPRQRSFARCALLRVAQWATDCRDESPQTEALGGQVMKQVQRMFRGLDEFVSTAQENGVAKNHITGKRRLYLGSFEGIMNSGKLNEMRSKVRLVLTSPPYPGVHVLYHRWQVNSRRETPAPFWFAGFPNGRGESHYTLGGRSESGIKSYFIRLRDIFESIRSFIHPDALLVQLVAFSNPETQLPIFLESMRLAGYEELQLRGALGSERPSRLVPNRRWYTHVEDNQRAGQEILIIHRPIR